MLASHWVKAFAAVALVVGSVSVMGCDGHRPSSDNSGMNNTAGGAGMSNSPSTGGTGATGGTGPGGSAGVSPGSNAGSGK